MATGRSALQAARKTINRANTKLTMTNQGWCETMVPTWLLEKLDISFEVVGVTSILGGGTIYAPVWVYAVWIQSETRTKWDQIEILLSNIKDDEGEKELVTAELIMSANIPLSTKSAANNYIGLLRAKRERESPHEQQPPSEDH